MVPYFVALLGFHPYIKQYSDFEVGCSKIVRELRTAYIPGFDQSELNLFVDYISTY